MPSQVAELSERITAAKARYLELCAAAKKQLAETSDSETWKHWSETMQNALAEYVSEWEDVLTDVLLPHQREQLDRTVLWSLIKEGGHHVVHSQKRPFRPVLENGIVKELIGIDESQARELKEQADQLQGEFARELAALHDKYEEKLREKLTQEQRHKLERLVCNTPAFFFQ